MILDLDIGNSRVKWRVTDADGRIGEMSCSSLHDLHTGLFLPHDGPLCRVRVASVRSSEIREAVGAWAYSRYGLRAEFAVSSAQVGCVRNGYKTPEKLGVDRWLALLAAFDRVQGSVCVFDFGSAMTSDMVDNTGQHLGGWIAPGMTLMRNSLISGTDLVRFSSQEKTESLVPARQTGDAVETGVLASAAGFALVSWRSFERIVGSGRAIVTGGDASKVLPVLEFPAAISPSLVLDGLALALP